MRTASPLAIVEHLRELRRKLSGSRIAGTGWTMQQIADAAGVAKQSLKIYCMLPSEKPSAARIIPAAALDRLGDVVTAQVTETKERGFPAFLNRDEHLWLVFGANLELILETTSPWRAEWHAARHNGVAMPGKDNLNHQSKKLSADDVLCIEWLGFRHGGLIAKADAMEIAEVDEYLIERVAHELPCWRIQPTAEQVRRIRELDERRWLNAA